MTEAGGRDGVTAAAARLGLTPREAEVLHGVVLGRTDRAIAALMGRSPRTVHKHLQHVYAKLGVQTRTAAAMRLLAAMPWNAAAALAAGPGDALSHRPPDARTHAPWEGD